MDGRPDCGKKAAKFLQRSVDEALRPVHTREHVARTSVKREQAPSCEQQTCCSDSKRFGVHKADTDGSSPVSCLGIF